MKKSVVLLAFISTLVILFSAQCGSALEAELIDSDVPTTPEELVNQKCTQCHGIGVVRMANRSEKEWNELVDLMITRGAELNDAEREVVLKYLIENYKE